MLMRFKADPPFQSRLLPMRRDEEMREIQTSFFLIFKDILAPMTDDQRMCYQLSEAVYGYKGHGVIRIYIPPLILTYLTQGSSETKAELQCNLYSTEVREPNQQATPSIPSIVRHSRNSQSNLFT